MAVLTVMASGDEVLLERIKRGWVPLLPTAQKVKGFVNLRRAYRAATPEDRIALARIEGATTMFDDVIAPAVEADVPAQ